MRRLSDYKGDKALDVLEELIDPIGEIAGDSEVVKAIQGRDIKKAAKLAIGKHRKSVVKMLSVLDGVSPEAYMEKVNVFTLPMALVDLLNDPELVELFRYQGQEAASSGSATVNTAGDRL